MVRGKAACLVDADYCDENVGVAHLSRGLFFARVRSGQSGRGRPRSQAAPGIHAIFHAIGHLPPNMAEPPHPCIPGVKLTCNCQRGVYAITCLWAVAPCSSLAEATPATAHRRVPHFLVIPGSILCLTRTKPLYASTVARNLRSLLMNSNVSLNVDLLMNQNVAKLVARTAKPNRVIAVVGAVADPVPLVVPAAVVVVGIQPVPGRCSRLPVPLAVNRRKCHLSHLEIVRFIAGIVSRLRRPAVAELNPLADGGRICKGLSAGQRPGILLCG